VVRVEASQSSGWFVLDLDQIALAAFAILILSALAGCSAQSASTAPTWSPSISQSAYVRPHMEVASWYGPGFQGHPTSTGERYNQYGLTAASTTLPLGTHVRVTNPENGRSVEVRINDRGPYVHGRTIDLSRGAAERIGITGAGVAPVQVASPTATPTTASVMPVTYAAPTRTARWRAPREHRVALYSSHRSTYHRSNRIYYRHSHPRMVADPIGAAISDTFRMF
jgi:rare lipoprotein A (peptidoglycan hydrolase)